MSTTFGVIIKGEDEPIKIARRSSGYMRFTNPLATILPRKTKVIAMDNYDDTINTVRDIINEIKNQKK